MASVLLKPNSMTTDAPLNPHHDSYKISTIGGGSAGLWTAISSIRCRRHVMPFAESVGPHVNARNVSRPALATLLVVSLTGCLATFAPQIDPASEQKFQPMDFFEGPTRGDGTLAVRGQAQRSLRVEGHGTRQSNGSLRLDQTVQFGDGVLEKRVWLISRLDSTHFRATLSDAKGDVTADLNGNVFHLRYLIRRPRVYMEQWLTLQSDGRSVANRAQVTVFGVPWARLTETITRVDSVGR